MYIYIYIYIHMHTWPCLHSLAELVELTKDGEPHIWIGATKDEVHHKLLHVRESIEDVQERTTQLHAHYQQLQCLTSYECILEGGYGSGERWEEGNVGGERGGRKGMWEGMGKDVPSRAIMSIIHNCYHNC